MNNDNGLEPFSNRFVNFWMGWWIAIYGIPILLKVIIGNHEFGIWSMFPPIWVIISGLVLYRNLKLALWKIILISCTGGIINIIISIINDRLFYGSIFMKEPSSEIIKTYNINRLIQLLVIIAWPIVVFIYTKLRIRQIKREH